MKVRRQAPPNPLLVERQTLEDASLADGALRTWTWLVDHDDGEAVDMVRLARARRVVVRQIEKEMVELERVGMIVRNQQEVVLTDPAALRRDEREALLEKLALDHERKRKEIQQRRQSRSGFRAQCGGDDASDKETVEKTVTAATIKNAWYECWREKWPDIPCVPWGVKELSIAKGLIARFEGEKTLKLVKMVFDQWEQIVARYRLRGFPSIEWCMKFKDTAVLELLSGKRIGADAPMDAGKVALKGGEYHERVDGEEDDDGWNDG